jgi:periplasmic divalent cation tolerance protein
MNSFLIFYVTHPDEATAARIAQELLQARMIACANIFPISSAYWWEGAIATEGEWVSILKTRVELESAVEEAILKTHPYQTPCIVRMEARANEGYLAWIEQSTT